MEDKWNKDQVDNLLKKSWQLCTKPYNLTGNFNFKAVYTSNRGSLDFLSTSE